jgi:signal peptidase I
MLTTSPLRARLRLVGNLLSALLLAVVVASGVGLVVVPKLTGSKPLAVLTGSMRPTYPPGAVVVVRPVDADELHVGDTLTYQIRSGEAEVITHRIVRISFGTDGRRRFVTRGDANGADDPDPVQEGQVRGTVWYSVPLVGYASTALDPRHRRTAVLAVSGGLVVYGVYLFAGGVLERRRRSAPARA